MKFLSKDNYFQEVKEIISDNESVDIAVAFWGKGAVDIFKGRKNYSKIRIICNLESSACNPNVIRDLKELGINIKTNRHLHAKVLSATKFTIIGSANISANGLSLENSELNGWLEAGILTEDKEISNEIKKWFEGLWLSSLEVSDKLLSDANDQWKQRRNFRPMPLKNKSILGAAQDNMVFFENRNIYFAIYRCKPTNEALNAFESEKNSIDMASDVSGSVGFYEEWHDLPNNALIIDVYYGVRGGVQFEGFWWTPEKEIIIDFSYKNAESGRIKLCFKRDLVCGYKLTSDFKSAIKESIEELWKYKSKKKKQKDEATLVPFVDGMKIVLKKYSAN